MKSKDFVTDKYSLLLGDCLERMKEIPSGSVDLILTDPPYGTTACKWDTVIDFTLMWEQLKRIIKPNGAIVLFGSEPFSSLLRCSNLGMFKYDWIWEKTRPSNPMVSKIRPLSYHENISVFYNKQPCYNPQKTLGKVNNGQGVKIREKFSLSNGIRTNYVNDVNTKLKFPRSVIKFDRGTLQQHPTQKPVALLEYLIKTYTNENETVLDFTFGSCSTGVACLNTNRRFIGVEMEEKYFDIGVNRMQESIMKGEIK